MSLTIPLKWKKLFYTQEEQTDSDKSIFYLTVVNQELFGDLSQIFSGRVLIFVGECTSFVTYFC